MHNTRRMMQAVSRVISLLGLVLLGPGGVAALRAQDSTPSAEQVRALMDRVIANQHRNDAALNEYERIECRREWKTARDTVPSDDKSFRVVPTGTGTIRVQISERGQPVDAERYREQLRGVENALVATLDPTLPRQKQAVEKFIKRTRERRELVDAIGKAFHFTWLGREARNGRTLAKVLLEPNRTYKPTSRTTGFLRHVRVTLWVDETAGQFERLEAEIISDISFGGGVLGKVYRGGRFVIEQEKVSPGVWLPTRYAYNVSGRKFLFGSELHQLTEASRYHRIGPPQDALVAIRRELSGGATPPFRTSSSAQSR